MSSFKILENPKIVLFLFKVLGIKLSERSIVTKLELLNGYKFKVKSDVDYLPIMLVDELKPEGDGLGPDPPHLLSIAVGHCMSSSLIYCLKKARVLIKNIETTVTTNLFRNEKGRLRIKNIDIQIDLTVKEVEKSRVNRCLVIFEDYCTVTQSIRKGIEVTLCVRLNE